MNTAGTLTDFLRSARARLAPGDVGLPVNQTVRRVPGLRRDEVAGIAGVSVDYYARMEQGRVTQASDAVINALSVALQMNETERTYLFTLLSASTGGRVDVRELTTTVRAPLRAIMDSLTDSPAFVLGPGMQVLAMNSLAVSLMTDFGARSGRHRSLARWTFLDPGARAYYLDWEQIAADVAAILRRDTRSHPHDAGLTALIAELGEHSPEFRTMWAEHRVYECTFGTKRLVHPVVGRIDVDFENFAVAGEPDQELFVYSTPAGSPSSDALNILAAWNVDRADRARDALPSVTG